MRACVWSFSNWHFVLGSGLFSLFFSVSKHWEMLHVQWAIGFFEFITLIWEGQMSDPPSQGQGFVAFIMFGFPIFYVNTSFPVWTTAQFANKSLFSTIVPVMSNLWHFSHCINWWDKLLNVFVSVCVCNMAGDVLTSTLCQDNRCFCFSCIFSLFPIGIFACSPFLVPTRFFFYVCCLFL